MDPITIAIAGAAVAVGSGTAAAGLLNWSWGMAEDKPAVKQIMRDNGLGSLADNLPG